MRTPLTLVFLFFGAYALIFLAAYNSKSGPSSLNDIYVKDKSNAMTKDLSFLAQKIRTEHLKRVNPLRLLEAYPKISKKLFTPLYNKVHFGLLNEDDYCERVDQYNLANPENMFENYNFFTDYFPKMIVREKVIPQIGDLRTHILGTMTKANYETAQYPFDTEITNFYITSDGFYRFHQIGKHFLCPTQMFNHIPGHKSIVRKDEVLKSVQRYAELNADKPQCFNRDMIFPRAYRLNVVEECQEFFKIINSEEYEMSLQEEPIQYLIKIGYGVHKSQGVFLLDDAQTTDLNNAYKFGHKCGHITNSIIAQKYITNPLLLDRNNKFDFRLYMFVASTNPLIVYYHDGYMRVSLNAFEKNSKDRATHLTNTYLAEKKFAEAREENKTINGMTAEELKDYHLWDFTDLQDYLLSIGKVYDPEWLENYLRPAVKKALVHVVRATSYTFWKQSNIHELYGLDFMLDEDLKLWFIEANPNPLLTGVKPELIERMLLDMFEIQYAYYHSRMKRVLDVVKRMQVEIEENDTINLEGWKMEYKAAVKNVLEQEYQVSKSNTWSLVIDSNLLPSSDAYSGFLDEECLMEQIDKK